MGKVKFSVAMSLDGFLAGPNPRLDEPLGGGEGGETGRDDEIAREDFENTGAYVMGRQMFGGGEGDWGDGSWKGWRGDDPPYRVPVFVLTHHPREPVLMEGGTTFHFRDRGDRVGAGAGAGGRRRQGREDRRRRERGPAVPQGRRR
jgi:dihydrofolate reductase